MPLKTCIITGANAGIGKAAAIQIAKEGYYVILACRSLERGEAALQDIKVASGSDNVKLLQLDISKQSSIKAFAQTVLAHSDLAQLDSIDCIIHNAAHFDITQKSPELTEDGIESIWATNHIGPVYLTSLLLERLKKSEQGRVLTVSSKGLLFYPNLNINLQDPEFKNKKFTVAKAYYHSKLAQVMYTYWLAEKLKDTRVTVNCIRVTNVKIDINRYPNISKISRFMYGLKSRFAISPEQMAETYTYFATSDEVTHLTGKHVDEKNKHVGSSNYSRQDDAMAQLMELSKSYLPEGITLS